MTQGLKTGLKLAAVAVLFLAAWEIFESSTRPAPTPDFTASTLKGESWSLAEARRSGPVLVDFFATWCGPCRMELPHVIELQRKYADRGLNVVVITREPRADVETHPDITGLPLPIVTDADAVFDAYGVNEIPRVFYFDPSGTVTGIEGYGEGALEKIEKSLQQLPVRSKDAARDGGVLRGRG